MREGVELNQQETALSELDVHARRDYETSRSMAQYTNQRVIASAKGLAPLSGKILFKNG